MVKPYKFPDTSDYGPNDPAMFCSSERALALYNQSHNLTGSDQKTSLAKTVKEWFISEAVQNNWIAKPVKHVETRIGAGFFLFNIGVASIENGVIKIPVKSPQSEDLSVD